MIILYNPQQNGVVERKNRTIKEFVKEMMHDQEFPVFLYSEAYITIVHIQNISPHQIMENQSHEEAFTKKKPQVGHLRIFGCFVYICVPKDKRRKLEPS